jgi:hypothetical protein
MNCNVLLGLKDLAKVLAAAHAREKKKKKRGTSRLAWSNVGTFLHLWFNLQMISLTKKPRSC